MPAAGTTRLQLDYKSGTVGGASGYVDFANIGARLLLLYLCPCASAACCWWCCWCLELVPLAALRPVLPADAVVRFAARPAPSGMRWSCHALEWASHPPPHWCCFAAVVAFAWVTIPIIGWLLDKKVGAVGEGFLGLGGLSCFVLLSACELMHGRWKALWCSAQAVRCPTACLPGVQCTVAGVLLVLLGGQSFTLLRAFLPFSLSRDAVTHQRLSPTTILPS